MSSLSSQFSLPKQPTFETQLAAFQDLSQLLSEDMDRANEAGHQFIKKTAEANWQGWLDIFAVSSPQDWFMTSTARTQSWFEQIQVYQQTLLNIAQNFNQKTSQVTQHASNFPISQFSFSLPDLNVDFVQASPFELSVSLEETPEAENKSSINTLKTRSVHATTVEPKPHASKKTSKTNDVPAKPRARKPSNIAALKPETKPRKPLAKPATTKATAAIAAKPSFPTVPGRDSTKVGNSPTLQTKKRTKVLAQD